MCITNRCGPTSLPVPPPPLSMSFPPCALLMSPLLSLAGRHRHRCHCHYCLSSESKHTVSSEQKKKKSYTYRSQATDCEAKKVHLPQIQDDGYECVSCMEDLAGKDVVPEPLRRRGDFCVRPKQKLVMQKKNRRGHTWQCMRLRADGPVPPLPWQSRW
jgi:hypothetical protein